MMATQPFPAQVAMQPSHPGMQHGHPIPGGQHPGAHMGGHPGVGMMQGMHPGVSGPQVTGPMVTGMPPGPGTPVPGAPMQQAHAMAHLGPAQQAFQQHNPQMNFGMHPQTAQHQNSMMLRQRQQMLQAQAQAQAQHGIPVSMPNAQGMNPAQMAQMRVNAQAGGMNMQQIQMMQAQAQHQQQQQQQQQQHQHQQQQQQQQHQQHQQQQPPPPPPHNIQQAQQQQQMMAQHQAQQAAMHAQQQQQQQQRQAQAEQQQMQLSRSQEANTQPPQSQSTPAPQPPPQIQPPPNLPQQPQQPLQGQPLSQNANNQQPQQSQGQTTQPQTTQQMAAQEAINKVAAYNNMQRNLQEMPKPFAGNSILQLVRYQDHLGNPDRPKELDYWESFVAKFFSPEGVLRQQLWHNKKREDKTYKIEYPSLPRFYLAHFTSGIDQIWMSSLGAREKDFAHVGHHTVWSGMASTRYTYKNGNAVITLGQVRVNFDAENRIELLDITTVNWKEYILRPEAPPDQKESPKLNKNIKRQQQQQPPKPALASPPIPDSRVNEYGVPKPLMQYLEMAEVFSAMTPLIQYSQSHPTITPQQALEKMVSENAARASQMAGMAQGNLNAPMQMSGQRTPGLNGANQFASPALAHLGLPTGQGSPHLGGPVHTPSPAQNHLAGPVAMVHQQSQQGSNLSGSQVTSANTSPNVTSKRRRASAVKLEDDGPGAEVNGTGPNRVRPSPKIGGKRQKGTA